MTIQAHPSDTATNPLAAARAASLRYVSDTTPGIRRKRAGTGFSYVDPSGKRVADPDTLARIRSLAIPPAWKDVWVCPDARGHIQATGLDARGRKQYRYHPKWRAVRDSAKFDRILEFAAALPGIREQVDADLARPGLPREKVLATIVRLLEETRIRIGNREYARANRSFGLTTFRDRHASFNGSEVRFEFKGKSGKTHSVTIHDRRVARIVKRCQDIPGYELFQYLDENGERHTVDSGDVNDYIREASGGDFTAKDFRTWAGTVGAARELCNCDAADSEREGKRQIVQAVERVASRLGNTPTVARKSYIHPAVLDAHLTGQLSKALDRAGQQSPSSPFDLSQEERCVVTLLEEMAEAPATKSAA